MEKINFADFDLKDLVVMESELKDYIKSQKAEMKANEKEMKAIALNEAIALGKEFCADKKAGDSIQVIFKGNIEDAIIREVSEKTLKITLSNLTREDGKPYNTAVKYDKIVIA